MLAHLAFYRAGIAAITEQDPYAGLLVSMHGAGIYRRRYGLQPELQLTFADGARQQVDAFVAEQEGAFEAKDAELGVTAEQRREDYELLQMHDRISLLFCMNDTLAPGGGEFGGYSFRGEGAGCRGDDPVPVRGRRAAVLAGAAAGAQAPVGRTASRSAPSCSAPSPSGRRSRSGPLSRRSVVDRAGTRLMARVGGRAAGTAPAGTPDGPRCPRA